MSHAKRLLLSVALAAHFASACNDGGEPEESGAIGDACRTDDDCRSDLECDLRICTRECSSDDDCDDTFCVARASDQICAPGCVARDVLPGYSCVGGRPVLCDDAGPDIDCSSCECPDGRCVPGVGCAPKAGVGETCTADADCDSDNCSRFAGICRVGLGDACDASNCDSCDVLGDWSSCSRSCQSDFECNGGLCWGSRSSGRYRCYERCSDYTARNCPVPCTYASAEAGLYCECEECTTEISLRALGVLCQIGPECATGMCLGAGKPCGVLDECTYRPGLCTQSCAEDHECGEGHSCVEGQCMRLCALDCPGGDSSQNCQADFECDDGHECVENQCMPRCDDDCAAGQCLNFDRRGGRSVYACEPRGTPGARCSTGAMCASENCENERCRGAAEPGADCVTDLNCASGACCGGVCRSAC